MGWSICIILLLVFTGCVDKDEPYLFKKLGPENTGVYFNNQITSSDSLNIQNYPFMYNGGGVAIGDINNDGLSDLIFSGNMVSNRLYLNKGDMKFEDVTESAGVRTNGWASGISMVDINSDGYLDIYVSMVSPEYADPDKRANLLFINNGDTTFTERAAEYNLDFKGHTIQAAFLDYDRDGDLDVYLLNHSPGTFSRNQDVQEPSSFPGQTSTSYDELYRNDGNGSYTRVTEEAGLLKEVGFGLGIAVSDVNRDGWPDIYISNDLLPDDVLYINNKDGTFSNKIDEYVKHTSFAGMGVDIADFNNDGWPDISQADMMPESLKERKQMSGGISYQRHTDMYQMGLTYQYSMNTLQLSNGINKQGDIIYSEIGRIAGVAYTDWSWSTLFGDYDNDGYKDLMITNGFPKAINNYDYLTEINTTQQFGTGEYRAEKKRELLRELKDIKASNYIFRNEHDLTFSDQTSEWGFHHPGYSFGAAQGDLDNDGDLDLVINNIDEPALIYRNDTDSLATRHYLSISLEGSPLNRNGIGSKIILKNGANRQFAYVSPYRGYQSSVDNRVHFGLDNRSDVDSLGIVWPDGRRQVLTKIKADQHIILNYSEADKNLEKNISSKLTTEDRLFTDVTDQLELTYRHKENSYNDYSIQGLLPYQLSKLGPAIASGDVNGNELDDIYVGGAAGQPSALFTQQDDGSFKKTDQTNIWSADKEYEDIDAVFFDANGNGRLDLYVASGGYEFSPASGLLQDRLYTNRGDGTFVKNEAALPQMLTSSSCVKPADFDKDGDIDLFVCGRMVPKQYPYAARSYILRNDGGSFTDVTSEIAPELVKPGLITDAVWSDFDGDGHLDLVTTGEWLPIQFHRNKNGTFEDVTESLGLASQTGWWYSIEQGDFDNDGDPDFVAGNLGLNYSYKTSENHKFGLFADDFDNNQSVDLLFSIERNGDHTPYYGKAKLGQHIPGINRNFDTYQEFSEATVQDVLGRSLMKDALHYQIETFTHVYLENREKEGFLVSKLPNVAQLSSVNSIISTDLNDDGNLDLVLAGNNYYTEPETARNDAGNGVVLIGDGQGNFEAASPLKSGLMTPYQVGDLKIITLGNQKVLLVANNDENLQMFRLN